MFILPIVLLALFISYRVYKKESHPFGFVFIAVAIAIALMCNFLGTLRLTKDTEVWSGFVEQVEHKEEWTEHITSKWKTETYYEKKRYYDTTSKTYRIRKIPKTRKVYVPPRTIYHEATNRIKTSDQGWLTVTRYMDRHFDDNFPNSNEELSQFWAVGDPTSSVHTYTNKVQASNSIYSSRGIDLTGYKELPEYPKSIENYTRINRLLGDFPNYKEARLTLDKRNSDLNIMKLTSDIEKLENRTILQNGEEDKKRSWKQVNIIFVNLKDKDHTWGFALQDYWENGNKNDYIVTMNLNDKGKVEWVHPFSWTEVEFLNMQVRDYFKKNKTVLDMSTAIKDVSDLVETHFVRKEFKDFEYLGVETPIWVYVVIWITVVTLALCSSIIKP